MEALQTRTGELEPLANQTSNEVDEQRYVRIVDTQEGYVGRVGLKVIVVVGGGESRSGMVTKESV